MYRERERERERERGRDSATERLIWLIALARATAAMANTPMAMRSSRRVKPACL